MANAAANDPAARSALLARFERRIRRVAAAILRVDADVEDAVQTTAIEVLASVGGFRGENLTAWVDRIAIRTAMRSARARRLRSARNAGEEALLTLQAGGVDKSFLEALPRPISWYLDELPPEQRTTLLLRHAHGYSIAEIAQKMMVSPNTVKYRLQAALEQVNKSIRRDIAIGRSRLDSH